MVVTMRSILEETGWEPVVQPLSNEPAYKMAFGNLEIEAAVFMNRHFARVFLLSGIMNDGRSLGMIESEVPVEVCSREQGLAFVGYALGSLVTDRHKPDWLRSAEAHRSHLPWEIKREAYRKRVMCQVERKWFRVARTCLREAADKAVTSDSTQFDFDSQVLSIAGSNFFLAMPAAGKAWEAPVAVSTQSLGALPLRLMDPVIEVSIWEGKLRIAGCTYAIIPGEPLSPDSEKPSFPCRDESLPFQRTKQPYP